MEILSKGCGMNTSNNYNLDAVGNILKVGDRVLTTQVINQNAFLIYATVVEIKFEDNTKDPCCPTDYWSSNIKILKDGSTKAGWNMRQKMIKVDQNNNIINNIKYVTQ